MRTRITALLATAALAGIGAVAPVASAAPAGSAAKSCGAGYKNAVINGASKCLGTGQFCSKSAASQYTKYGFKCKPGSDGRYRLFKK